MSDNSKESFLYKLRRCTSIATLEKVIGMGEGKYSGDELAAFNSAADHRLAELTMNKLFDKIPKDVWRYVK